MVVLVVRMIGASICDALCIDLENSSYVSELLVGYAEVEESWQNIVIAIDSFDGGTNPRIQWKCLAGIIEIRSNALNGSLSDDFQLCQLTLQPCNNLCHGVQHHNNGELSDLIWGDSIYYSIAANF